MTVREFIKISMDTRVIVRDKQTGKFLRDGAEYNDREVVGVYAKSHRCGNPPMMRAEIVVMCE